MGQQHYQHKTPGVRQGILAVAEQKGVHLGGFRRLFQIESGAGAIAD